MTAHQALIAKLVELPAERLAEVEDFVDFLRSRDQDRAAVTANQAASEAAFGKVWSNPEDGVYDGI